MARGSLGSAFGTLALVGCGLSLAVDPTSATPPPEQDAAASVTPPTAADGSRPDTSPPTATFDVRQERPVPPSGVVALAFDPAGALVALVYDASTTNVSAIDVTTTATLFTSPEPNAPSSLVALGKRAASPLALYAIPADRGLFAFIESETTSRVYGARVDAGRAHGRDGHVFVGAMSSSGTKIVACGARFPDVETDCDNPATVYDGQELGGFAVSPNGLLLAGLTGMGDAARIALFSRMDTASAFTTPVPITLAPGAAGKVAEIVDVSDDGLRFHVRGPCRTTSDATCLLTIGP